MKKNLVVVAEKLFDLTAQIKTLTAEADALKKVLRLEEWEEIAIDGAICKKVKTLSPDIDPKKVYVELDLTIDEIAAISKVEVGKLKKYLRDDDEYNDLMDKIKATWKETVCIKFVDAE